MLQPDHKSTSRKVTSGSLSHAHDGRRRSKVRQSCHRVTHHPCVCHVFKVLTTVGFRLSQLLATYMTTHTKKVCTGLILIYTNITRPFSGTLTQHVHEGEEGSKLQTLLQKNILKQFYFCLWSPSILAYFHFCFDIHLVLDPLKT